MFGDCRVAAGCKDKPGDGALSTKRRFGSCDSEHCLLNCGAPPHDRTTSVRLCCGNVRRSGTVASLRAFPVMRYRIEYLTESTDERSVCLTMFAEGSVGQVTEQAWRRAHEALGADGFQIRDLDQDGLIVMLETFSLRRVLH